MNGVITLNGFIKEQNIDATEKIELFFKRHSPKVCRFFCLFERKIFLSEQRAAFFTNSVYLRKRVKIMTTAITHSTEQRIAALVNKLPSLQQSELEKQLSLLVLRNEAERLGQSVVKNTVSMKEIVNEVRKVRHAK